MKHLLAILIVLLGGMHSVCWAYPTGKLTAKVIDEQGISVAGAEVTFGFTVGKGVGEGWGTKGIGIAGLTDQNGLFLGTQDASSYVTIHVEKQGYYHSGQKYEFKSKSLLNRWEPWNPTVEVILKKKRNPVPMYLKNTGVVKIPKLDEPIGYDLEKGDWVAPYGLGTISDFIFTYRSVEREFRDYEVSIELAFSNEKDGIQEYFFDKREQSYYKWPFQAPEDGYVAVLKKERIKVPGKTTGNERDDVNYIFRIRTKVDKHGNIIDARYGMISKEIGFDPGGKMRFTYYFNPDGTRNLEFDDKRNLFEKAKWK